MKMKASRRVLELLFLLTAVFYGVSSLSLLGLLGETDEPELLIKPEGKVLTIPSSDPFIVHCIPPSSKNLTSLEWIDNLGRVVPEKLTFPQFTMVLRTPSSLQLWIVSAKKDWHTGKFTCLGEYNDTLNPGNIGKLEASVNITVLDKPRIYSFENVTVEEGRMAVIQCSAKSNPIPNITIRKAGGSNFSDYQDDRIEVKYLPDSLINTSAVTMRNVKRSDEGLYYCIAEVNGYYHNATAYLEVQFAPNITATTSKRILSWYGNFTNLTCIAEANPPAVISWEFENTEIGAEDQYTFTYGRTVVSQILIDMSNFSNVSSNVYGIYTCIATNVLGSTSVEITLQETVVPGQITQVIFHNITTRSISFNFFGPTDDGGEPVIAYVVRYSTPEDKNDSVIEWPKGSSYTLTNLRPGGKYTFKVAAKNIIGIGDWKTVNYFMPKDINETIIEPNTLITKNVNITDYPDRYEIRWKVHDDYGMLKRFFVVTYFNDGRVKVEHQNGNTTFPL